LGHLDIDGRIILKWILKKMIEDIDYTHIAMHRVQWRAAENTKNEIGGVCSTCEMKNAHTIFFGKPEENRPLGHTSVDGRMILK
jgi:hypothetical protein